MICAKEQTFYDSLCKKSLPFLNGSGILAKRPDRHRSTLTQEIQMA